MRSWFIKPAYMLYYKVRRGVPERLFAAVEFQLTGNGLSFSSCRPAGSRRDGSKTMASRSIDVTIGSTDSQGSKGAGASMLQGCSDPKRQGCSDPKRLGCSDPKRPSRVGDRSDLKVVVFYVITFCNWVVKPSQKAKKNLS